MTKNRFFSIVAAAGLVSLAACGGSDAGTGDDVISADTTAIQGMDTVDMPTAVPTTDTVVTTTTVDTIAGSAGDTVTGDTVARP